MPSNEFKMVFTSENRGNLIYVRDAFSECNDIKLVFSENDKELTVKSDKPFLVQNLVTNGFLDTLEEQGFVKKVNHSDPNQCTITLKS